MDKIYKKINDIEQKEKQINQDLNTLNDNILNIEKILNYSEETISNIENEFLEETKLEKKDLAFLILGIVLHCIRIYYINNLTKIEKAGKGNFKEEFLHDIQEEKFKDLEFDSSQKNKRYYASSSQIVSTAGVPYDATNYVNKNYGLFKNANHRFSTLGHDPFFGLFFGTANILTNTISCSNKGVITSNHVIYDSNMKNPKIGVFASTIKILEKSMNRIETDLNAVIAAIIKQIIHIGTDIYTPCGIHIPGANLLLSNKTTEELTKYISTGDILKFGSASIASYFINLIISIFHYLSFDSELYDSNLIKVKTRKIIVFSNIIASSSNVLDTILKENIKNLDFGGLVITLQEIYKSNKIICAIEEEFINSKLSKIIDESQKDYETITDTNQFSLLKKHLDLDTLIKRTYNYDNGLESVPISSMMLNNSIPISRKKLNSFARNDSVAYFIPLFRKLRTILEHDQTVLQVESDIKNEVTKKLIENIMNNSNELSEVQKDMLYKLHSKINLVKETEDKASELIEYLSKGDVLNDFQ